MEVICIWLGAERTDYAINALCTVFPVQAFSVLAELRISSCPLCEFTIHSVLIKAAPPGVDQKA